MSSNKKCVSRKQTFFLWDYQQSLFALPVVCECHRCFSNKKKKKKFFAVEAVFRCVAAVYPALLRII